MKENNIVGRKGWSDQEIADTLKIIKSDKFQDYVKIQKQSNVVVYWGLIMLMVVCNFAASIFLIPLLVTAENHWIYLMAFILGLVFGLLFDIVIRNLEHIEKHHHLIASILILLLAVLNFVIVVIISNKLDIIFGLEIHHNPVFVSLWYAAAFIGPYLFNRFVR